MSELNDEKSVKDSEPAKKSRKPALPDFRNIDYKVKNMVAADWLSNQIEFWVKLTVYFSPMFRKRILLKQMRLMLVEVSFWNEKPKKLFIKMVIFLKLKITVVRVLQNLR